MILIQLSRRLVRNLSSLQNVDQTTATVFENYYDTKSPAAKRGIKENLKIIKVETKRLESKIPSLP